MYSYILLRTLYYIKLHLKSRITLLHSITYIDRNNISDYPISSRQGHLALLGGSGCPLTAGANSANTASKDMRYPESFFAVGAMTQLRESEMIKWRNRGEKWRQDRKNELNNVMFPARAQKPTNNCTKRGRSFCHSRY